MDWVKFLVHFIFGTIMGASIAFATCAFIPIKEPNPLIIIVLFSIILGLIAAIFGDSFWEWMKESNWWNPFDWL